MQCTGSFWKVVLWAEVAATLVEGPEVVEVCVVVGVVEVCVVVGVVEVQDVVEVESRAPPL